MMSDPESNALERLSALMDGEADEAALREVCGSWQAQASCRAAWHAYHLIGDVLRSEDLAAKAGRGSALLGAVRERLADEPTLLVPRPGSSPLAAPCWCCRRRRLRRRWPCPRRRKT